MFYGVIVALVLLIVGFGLLFYFILRSGAIEKLKMLLNTTCGAKEFRGEGSQFDSKWYQYWWRRFVAVLVTLLLIWTLGLGRAWMNTWFRRWVYSRTKMSGKQMAYAGTTVELWVKRIIWTLLSIVTFGIYHFFFRAVREEKYLCERLSFTGESDTSKFHGRVLEYFVMKVARFFMYFSVIGIPGATSLKYTYRYANWEISGKKIVFHGTWNSVLSRNILWAVLTMLSFFLWAIFAKGNARQRWISENTTIADAKAEK